MNDKIKQLLENAEQSDAIAINKWRIENRKQLREQRKKELKELMEKDKTMSNNKQSSVEWFAKEINELNFWLESRQITNREFNRLKLKVLNKAKEKHKEEVLSFDTLLHKHEMEALNNNTILLTKEEFYNETFGGNNEQQ